MAGWTCPDCGRMFARRGQGHECTPAITLDEYFETATVLERPVFDAVMEHLETLGPIHVEPVSVGIFLKADGSFVELRPKQKWVALSFALPHPASHRTITRAVQEYHGRYYHVANLRGPDDVDEDLCDLLTEAYLDAAT